MWVLLSDKTLSDPVQHCIQPTFSEVIWRMKVSASLWMKDAGILVFARMPCADSAEAPRREGHLGPARDYG